MPMTIKFNLGTNSFEMSGDFEPSEILHQIVQTFLVAADSDDTAGDQAIVDEIAVRLKQHNDALSQTVADRGDEVAQTPQPRNSAL